MERHRFTGLIHPLHLLVYASVVILGMISAVVYADDRHQHDLGEAKILPLKLALIAALEAEEVCADDGYRVSVAVVDRGGLVKAHIRGNGAGPHTLESARKKAYTSASLGRPTTALVDVVVSFPATEGLRDMNNDILILGGGLPIAVDGEIIAGIGVGGAPGGDLDEVCAQAGIDKLMRRLGD